MTDGEEMMNDEMSGWKSCEVSAGTCPDDVTIIIVQ